VTRESRLFARFRGLPVLVVGDAMVDASVRGSAERLSAEAPVPVIRAREDAHVPGGAGNVACNLAGLGARVFIASVRGMDPAGRTLESDLQARGVLTEGLVTEPGRPTISKTRIIAGHQQLARLDRESLEPLPEEALRSLRAAVSNLIPRVKAVVISDYGKGVVNRSLLPLVLSQARRRGVLVTVDPKPEHFLYYRGVDCLTPNTKEAAEGMRALPVKTPEELLDLGRRILRTLRCRSCLITQGEKGMTLFEAGGGRAPVHIPTSAKEVFDVTGAGDTVIAAFTLARAAGASLAESARLSNAAAGVVVGKLGTAAITLRELREAV
jgi:D-beta-D-heptose 7-phosphate kinase/D-beta-D-heptose 1-phosphate adenosyltransferase